MPRKKERTKSNNYLPWIGIILLAVLFAVLLLAYKNPRPNHRLANLSNINFSGMEPPVVAKIQQLREGVQKHADSADAWGKLAMNLDAADLQKDAIAAYQQAAALNSSDFRWPYFCAIALSQSDPRQSVDWFERAYRTKPDYVPLIINYGDALFQQGKADQAAEKYKEAIQRDPKAAHADFGLAQIAFSKGDLQTARQYLQLAVASEPGYAEAYNLL